MNGIANLLNGPNSILGPHFVFGVFLLFCRIGACLMIAPGFSSVQVPAQARLFIALAVTFCLTPILLVNIPNVALDGAPTVQLQYIFSELLVGASIGILSRLFFLALETMVVASATGLGLANVFGAEFDQSDALPPLASFITISATALIFITNLHWQILSGIVASYRAVPISELFRPGFSLRQIGVLLVETFRIALRVCSPFIVYAIVVNLAISVINRLTPQIAIFYISTPFVIGGGMVLLYLAIKSVLGDFTLSFSSWLTSG